MTLRFTFKNNFIGPSIIRYCQILFIHFLHIVSAGIGYAGSIHYLRSNLIHIIPEKSD